MEKLRQILHKLLFPHAAVLILGVPVSAALLIYTFLLGHENETAAYLSYVISAYVTAVVCLRIPKAVRGASALVHQNKYTHRYLTDIPFRMHLSLRLSLAVNLLYAAMNLFNGAYYGSVWFGTLAVYYIFLAVMRFLLLRHANRRGFGADRRSELRRYRLCGIVLMVMNIALSGVVVLVVYQNEGFTYAGYLIYVMAMYAFYAVTMAIINVVRYRKYQSPVMSAAKAINLAAALVSMLSLETAMLAQFGGDDPAYRRMMTAVSGGAVCAVVLAMAVYMIVRATARLKIKEDL